MITAKTIRILILLVLSVGTIRAQCPNGSCGTNLLTNPDFEITSTACADASLSCILYYDSSKVAGWWGTAPSSGGISQYNTGDYSNPLCTGVFGGCNNFGVACSGTGHVWLAENMYEYLQSELLAPLQAGKSYCFTFTYRLGFNTTGFGIWVHNLGKVFHSGNSIYNIIPPAVTFNTTGGSGCQTATLSFTAAGGETWILIGPTVYDQEITLDNFFLREQCPVGLSEAESNGNPDPFIIYPNPGNGAFTVQVQNSNTMTPTPVFVFNALGQIVHQIVLSDAKTDMDLSELGKGVYSVQLNSNGNVFCKRIIVL